jgi:hypothetical protein
MRKTLFIVACIAVLSLSACTGESKRPVATGKGGVRAINTIPTSPTVLFLIEERSLATVEYATGSNRSPFDDFEYIFNFEAVFPDNILQQRIASSTVKVETDREYTFLITGDLAAPTIIVWDDVIRVWEATETTFQARFAHTAQSLGPIDIYFAAPATPPVAGQAVGTLAFGELLPAADYEAGDFVYTITTAGDPNDILFTSNTLSPTSRIGFIISVFDGTANDPSPLAVRTLNDAGGTNNLADANILPTIRFLHASAALDPSDVYTDELLMDQILTNHAYRDVTDDIELLEGNYTFTYTSVGNVGSILFEGLGSVFPATRNQLYVIGGDLALASFIRIPDRRSVETLVKLTFIHTAVNHPLVDFYVVEAGTDIADQLPRLFNVNPVGSPIEVNLDEGDLDFYLTVAGEKTVIVGPVAVTTTLGDVLEYVSYDNVDPATADLVLIPLP